VKGKRDSVRLSRIKGERSGFWRPPRRKKNTTGPFGRKKKGSNGRRFRTTRGRGENMTGTKAYSLKGMEKDRYCYALTERITG